jgi:aspartate ammonia-lyase
MTEKQTATYRTESDSMGDKQIPSNVYYGIQTLRAIENFPISGIKPLSTYVDACVLIKKATAIANGELGCIPEDISQAIVQAADEILAGKLRDQFVVDVYQAGAGTSHHMNVNEVLSNRALEIMGDAKGNYKRVNPNDRINYSRSTNDLIPTANPIGGLLALEKTLLLALSQAVEAACSCCCSRIGCLRVGLWRGSCGGSVDALGVSHRTTG